MSTLNPFPIRSDIEYEIPPFALTSEAHYLQAFYAGFEEQAAGTNPLALIFPGPKGRVINLNSFSSEKMRPTLDALGMKMPAYYDAWFPIQVAINLGNLFAPFASMKSLRIIKVLNEVVVANGARD